MRSLRPAALALLAACSAGTEVPVTTAPRHATRVESNQGMLVLDTNTRLEATRHPAQGTPAQLWPALVRTYQQLGIGVAHVDTSRFVLGNPDLPVRTQFAGDRLSNLLDCGRTGVGVPIADRYSVTVQIFTQLVPTASGTEVRSVLSGRAVSPTTNDPPVRCNSTGRLEGRIVTTLALQGA